MKESTVASAHIKGGELTIVGLHQCALGPIPFRYSAKVEGIEDGKVDFGKEDPKVNEAIEKAQAPMAGLIERNKMREAARELVERARLGDQNAMAMISCVREQAEQGNKRARTSFRLLKEYIEKHPSSDGHYSPESGLMKTLGENVGDDAAISAWAPGVSDSYVAAVVVAGGPPLTKDRVSSIGAHFGEDAEVYMLAVCSPFRLCPPEVNPSAYNAGCVVGIARKIQGVNSGKFPVSAISPMAGWELGE